MYKLVCINYHNSDDLARRCGLTPNTLHEYVQHRCWHLISRLENQRADATGTIWPIACGDNHIATFSCERAHL